MSYLQSQISTHVTDCRVPTMDDWDERNCNKISKEFCLLNKQAWSEKIASKSTVCRKWETWYKNGFIITSSAQPQRRVRILHFFKRKKKTCWPSFVKEQFNNASIAITTMHFSFNHSELEWIQFILWGEIISMVAHWYGYHHKMSHSKLVRRAPCFIEWNSLNFIEHLVRRCGQMNDMFIPLQCVSVRLCWYAHCTTKSYVPHTPVTPLRRRRRHHASHELTHTHVCTHATYMQTLLLFLFMNENLTVYEPCAWLLFALVLCLAFCFSSILCYS